jgi:hypothetical protein
MMRVLHDHFTFFEEQCRGGTYLLREDSNGTYQVDRSEDVLARCLKRNSDCMSLIPASALRPAHLAIGTPEEEQPEYHRLRQCVFN